MDRLLFISAIFVWFVFLPLFALAAGNRVIFVTSVTGTGNLGNWANAGGQTGIAAGDVICQARATTAGLANPGNFVAWLSDTASDAYCRAHNLPGTKAANCGQPALPAAAGPWVRTDGVPFSPGIGALTTTGAVYTPVRYNEFGSAIPPQSLEFHFTATNPDGTLRTSGLTTCADWTSAAAASFAAIGAASHTTSGWSSAGGIGCSVPVHLLCMETGAGPPLPPFTWNDRLAFITSASGPGDLSTWPTADPGTSGLTAGDSICRNLAADAGYPQAESFKAWLSDATTDAFSRFNNDQPWMRPDGVRVAAGIGELTSGLLFTSISVSDQGAYMGNKGVWTGTQDDGIGSANHCTGWTDGSAGASGDRGSSDRTADGWSLNAGAGSAACNSGWLHLYCLSDAPPDVIFADSFE